MELSLYRSTQGGSLRLKARQPGLLLRECCCPRSCEGCRTCARSRPLRPLHEDPSLSIPISQPTCPGLRAMCCLQCLAPLGNSGPHPNPSGQRRCPLAGPGHWDPFLPGRLGVRHPYRNPHSSSTCPSSLGSTPTREHCHQPALPPQGTPRAPWPWPVPTPLK